MEVEEILQRARQGPAALLGRRFVAVVLSLVSIVVLPRLVTPEAYGLAAMSAVVFSFAETLKDFGLTNALMRKGSITDEEINFLFWFNCAVTALLALLIGALAPLIGAFFHAPVVSLVIIVSLIGFLTGGASLQHRAILERELRYRQLAGIDVAVMFVQFAATIALAKYHLGLWALVLGGVLGSVVGSIAVFTASKWTPSRFVRASDARELLSFGFNTSIYALSVLFSNNLLTLVLGRLSGAAYLGQYNRTAAILAVPLKNVVEPLTGAALPVLARLRPYPSEYKKAYLDLLRRLNYLLWPSAMLALIAGPDVVIGVLGARWHTAAVMLQVMSPVIACWGLGYTASEIFITQDRANEMMLLGIGEVTLRTTLTLLGIFVSPLVATAAFSLSTCLVVCLRIFVAGRVGPVTRADHVRALGPCLAPCTGALLGASCAGVLARFGTSSALCAGAAELICGVGAAALLILASAHGRKYLREFLIGFGISFRTSEESEDVS